jgi:hypothetical protein
MSGKRASPWLALLFLGTAPLQAGQPTPETAAFFENQVRPLLAGSCFKCHGPKKQQGGLRLDSRAALLQGGDNGPVVVPGAPEKSRLIQAVRQTGDLKMPPQQKLTPAQIAALVRWVKMGAPWAGAQAATTRGGAITAEERQFWSFQPVRNPPVPAVKDTAWPLSEVDRFILARLEAKGLRPVRVADKCPLIRRATFDLIGLPPTPAEVNAFLADSSPDAFARVVERLLASPAYGERWGRHWLDVVRYADTAGETADFPVPEAYLYRNYVIDAFNRDKPYDRFLREQVGGDLLARQAPREQYAELVTATGFLAVSRRFGFDPQNYQHLTIQDTIDTLGQAVLGLSLGCARCHHHKFDPVTTSDYYALYGIFDSSHYAFPGSEEKNRPRDFPSLLPPAEAETRRKAKQPVPGAYAVAEGKSHNARIHKRGEPRQLGDEVPRRFLDILGGDPLPPEEKGSGRLQLAEWLTRPGNPLTARVMVNRVWQHHFGKGLVATPNDFGSRGRRPTHPELLDYLAHRFMAGGWSVKALHCLLMLSRTYQLSSEQEARLAQVDPANELHGRFDRRRLDAESIRDALLSVGGNLDRSRGAAHPFPPVGKWGFTQHNPFVAVYPSNRRSVYLMTQRLRRHPFLALFDGPDPNASTARRIDTTVPTQALFLMNDPFVYEQSAGFARRILAARPEDAARVEWAYQVALARRPSAAEVREALDFVRRYRELLGRAEQQQPWEAFARTLLARNEFLFVD